MLARMLRLRLTRKFKLLSLSFMHGTVHAVIIVYPVVLDAIRTEFGWGLNFAGWVGTAGFALFGITSLPTGWLADRLSRKSLLGILLAGLAAGALLMAGALNSWMFIAGWLLAGIFGGMYHPLALSIIVGSFSEGSARALAWHGSGGNVTVALTPLLAGLIASYYSWRAAFLLGAGLALLALLLLSVVPHSPHSEGFEKSETSLPDWDKLWILLLAHCLTGFIYRGVVTFIPHSIGRLWGTEIALFGVGGFTTLVILCGIGGHFLGGWLERHLDFWNLYLGQVITYSLILILIPFLQSWFFILALVLWGIAYYSTQPVVNSFIGKFGDRSSHGRLYGLAFFTNYGLGSIGAGIAGLLLEYGGIGPMYWGLALIALTVTAVLQLSRGKLNKS